MSRYVTVTVTFGAQDDHLLAMVQMEIDHSEPEPTRSISTDVQHLHLQVASRLVSRQCRVGSKIAITSDVVDHWSVLSSNFFARTTSALMRDLTHKHLVAR